MQQAFTLLAQPFKARVGGTVYENLLIDSLNDPCVTLRMPTPATTGEPDRLRTWRLDQVEVIE